MMPSRFILTLLVLLTAFASSAQILLAQQSRDPRLGYVFPAGGQRGTTVKVNVGGQFLDGTTAVLVSGGDGVSASVVKINEPLPGKRLNELRDYLEEARKKLLEPNAPPSTPPNAQPSPQPVPPATVPPVSQSIAPVAPQTNLAPTLQPAASPAPQPNAQPVSQPTPPPAPPPSQQSNAPAATKPAFAKPPFLGPEKIAAILKESGATDDEIKKFLEVAKERNNPKRQQNQQLSETATLKIEIASNAPIGARELRFLKPSGVSNPISFCVGQFPEQVNASPPDKTPDPAGITPITLPVVVNGQILPGEVHHFSFVATRGMHLVIAAQGRDLMPYLADAVPGWFQPALALFDAKGAEVAYADHFLFHSDPVLDYDVPEDGTYRLEVKDLLFRGREDFVYRISIGEIPFVRSIFPLGGPTGAATAVTVSGWNLPSAKTTFTPPAGQGVYPIPGLSNGYATENVLFAGDALPQTTDAEPNNTPKLAQRLTLPMMVNGRIDPPGDVDVFAVSCRAGEQIVAEVNARRLNSPLDSWLKITDANGRQLALNDDHEDKGAGLLTQGADSYVTFTAPTNGLYYVHLGDAQGKGGPEYAYRLRISAPRQDYALYLTPSGVNGRAGASVPVTIHAVRKDGFAGDIFLNLKDASTGFVLDGGKIPAGLDTVRATLTFPQTVATTPVPLALEGHATIDGHDVVRPVRPADDMIQAFAYHHLVPANQLIAMAAPGLLNKPPVKVVSPGPMQLASGGLGQAIVSLGSRFPPLIADVRLLLTEAPDGISVGDIFAAPGGAAISFKADAAKAKPGLKGNLIVEAFIERTPPAVAGRPAEKKRWSIGFLPAIPFEVVGSK